MRRRQKGSVVEMAATRKGEDLRRFDANGRWTCTKEHPWDGTRESAPHGVSHMDVVDLAAGDKKCLNCGVKW